jgi:FkbM family methyltransferase
MRAVLRSVSRNRVIRKRLPDDLGGGVMFCSPDALLSMWKPGWRSEQAINLFAWARRFVKAGDVVWDVGANQGLFAFAAAAVSGASGHVVAFEPDPFLVGLLHRSRLAQSLGARVDVLPVAVGSDSGVATFCVARKDRALSHLASVASNPHTGGDRERFSVLSVTLDWVAQCLPPPDVIKVDVEGAELGVLEHAGIQLLQRVRPRWIIEVAAENARRIEQILRAARYRLFDANAPENEVESPVWDTLAVPEEECDAPGAIRAGGAVSA